MRKAVGKGSTKKEKEINLKLTKHALKRKIVLTFALSIVYLLLSCKSSGISSGRLNGVNL